MVSSRLRMTLATVVQAASSAGSSLGSAFDSPTCSNFPRRIRIRGGRPQSRARPVPQNLPLLGRGLARGGQPEREVDACRRIAARLDDHALRQRPRRLHVSRIVQQHQRLQRRVGAGAARGAFFAIRRVERVQRRGRGSALPERVHAAPVKIRARARRISLRGIDVAIRGLFPQPFGLIGEHARSTEPLDQQAADRERVVANHLRRQPEARPAGQQPILRILFQQLRRDSRSLPVRGRRDDQPLHRAHVPAACE